MLVPNMSSKIVSPLDSPCSDSHTPFNWTIDTVIVVLCAVVSVECLLRLENSRPGTIRGFTGNSAFGASIIATVGVAGIC